MMDGNNPTYEDVGEDGMPSQSASNEMEKKARSPKTALQRLALQATGRKYFGSASQHKEFKAFEAKAVGADPESRVWYAWLTNRIELAGKYKSTLENLVKSFGNDIKRDVWFGKNRKAVLAKPTVSQLTSNMEDRMKRLMNGEKK